MHRIRLALPIFLISIPFSAVAAERWPVTAPADMASLQEDLEDCEAARPDADQCLDVLIALSDMAGDAKAGERHAREAVLVAERTLAADHPDVATSYDLLAHHLSERGVMRMRVRLTAKRWQAAGREIPPNPMQSRRA
jgi:hypothetical protein